MTAPAVGPGWPGGRALQSGPAEPLLGLDEGIAQRQATYRFELTDGVTGQRLGDITPIRFATLSHNTSQSIKRQLGLSLGVADTAAVDPIRDRVSPFMVIPGAPCPDTRHGDWPLGRYMWADDSVKVSTGGNLGQPQLVDEMGLVDRAILAGINGMGRNVSLVALEALTGLPIKVLMEPSPYLSADAWGIGAMRGQILETLSVAGDYWSPWFSNAGPLRLVRTFDPASAVPSINLDVGAAVFRDSIVRGTNQLDAPNIFIVISNAGTGSAPIVGRAEVPPTSPNSIFNRGFSIPYVVDLQLSDAAQAQAVAQNLALRRGIYETVALSTAPDPRHDSYNVVRFDGVNWLTLSWSLTLREGAAMQLRMRRTYGPAV